MDPETLNPNVYIPLSFELRDPDSDGMSSESYYQDS